MIDYNTFTINTNIILLFNNIFSNLFYTIIFINYCNFYKLYTQSWGFLDPNIWGAKQYLGGGLSKGGARILVRG